MVIYVRLEGLNRPSFCLLDLAIARRVNKMSRFSNEQKKKTLSMLNLSQAELGSLETSLLNLSGNIHLHNRFRALFTLKALKNDDAVRIISKGEACSPAQEAGTVIGMYTAFQDPSALLKHELAYCLGQMKNTTALPILESVLANAQEDPMVRHEASRCLSHIVAYTQPASRIHMRRRQRQWVPFPRPHLCPYSKNI